MKQHFFIISLLSAVLFTGCSQKAPELPDHHNISDTDTFNGNDALSGDTVSINENTYGNESQSNAQGSYNSSSDGFQSIYFGFGDYAISSGMEANMRTNIQRAKSAGSKIKIEGNCDEFGTDEYNYALGLKRAKSVKDALVSQGIISSKMIMVSFGESSPICQTATSSCYDKNRRVDLRLVR